MSSAGCQSIQLIDAEGNLHAQGLDGFSKNVKLLDCGYSYSIVSIIGPQTSGKSTLVNNLFHTNFKMMDREQGLSQTTKGIWMAKCNNVEPFTIVMDIEGIDGRERKDDTAFEKRSALFAFAVSDLVMINMDWRDVGKMHAGCKHLLKTVFQHMVRYFDPRETSLLIVLRDMATLGVKLEGEVVDDMNEIWEAATRGTSHEQTPFSDYFKVEVTALDYYKGAQFKSQVDKLRERFSKPVAREGRAMVPASGFSFSVQNIWKIVQEDEDLDLPAIGELVSAHIFSRVASELLHSFMQDQHWLALEQVAKSGPVKGFGDRVSTIRDDYLKKYDNKTSYVVGKSKSEKRQKFQSDILDLVKPVVQKKLNQLHSTILDESRDKIDDTLKDATDPNKAAELLVQDCLDKFSKLSKDLLPLEKDFVSEMLARLENDITRYAKFCVQTEEARRLAEEARHRDEAQRLAEEARRLAEEEEARRREKARHVAEEEEARHREKAHLKKKVAVGSTIVTSAAMKITIGSINLAYGNPFGALYLVSGIVDAGVLVASFLIRGRN